MGCFHYEFRALKIRKIIELETPFGYLETNQLAKAILQKEGLKQSWLILFNSQTGKLYGPLNHIPCNSALTVCRIPK